MLNRGQAIWTQAHTLPLPWLLLGLVVDIISNFLGNISLNNTIMDRIPRECNNDRIRDRIAGLPCLPRVPSMIPMVLGSEDSGNGTCSCLDERGCKGCF